MLKGLFCLLMCFSCALPQLKAQDIDSPLSRREIEKYESRVRLCRQADVAITHPDAYLLRTSKAVYPDTVKIINLTIINRNAPPTEPQYPWLMVWEKGKWVRFPFKPNMSFAGIGYLLTQGKTFPEEIRLSAYQNPLQSGKRYQANIYVSTDLDTYCILGGQKIRPVSGTEHKEAFTFRVLESEEDSLRILFENHTNLVVVPLFFPSVGSDEEYMLHPFARSGWSGEAEYMRKFARMNGGEAMIFTIPVSWDVKCITDPNYRKKFSKGRLQPGKYKIGLQLRVYLNTEFEVRSSHSGKTTDL